MTDMWISHTLDGQVAFTQAWWTGGFHMKDRRSHDKFINGQELLASLQPLVCIHAVLKFHASEQVMHLADPWRMIVYTPATHRQWL